VKRAFAAAVAALVLALRAFADPVLEPTTQKFVDGLAAKGGPPIYTLSPDAARKVLSDAQSGPIGKVPASIEDTSFPVGPTGKVAIRILRPEGAKEVLPVVLYMHGGGWVLGDRHTHERLTREIAAGAKVAVVFVDYDRSPEARYPIALEQSYAALLYVAAHGKQLGVDPTRIAVAGDSAGGNLAAAIALLAKERKGPKLRMQVLLYPVTDANFETASYREFANGPWLTKPAMQWFWDSYLPDVAKRKEPTASPLQATPDQLTGLPDALVIVAANDVLRDEGEAFAQKLAQAGVRVTAIRADGTIHDFAMLNALAETPAVRSAIGFVNGALSGALRK
jgi:acetyl esterase/lipase